MDYLKHWIPACAGMTAEVSFLPLSHSDPSRHSSESSPAWMQVVERRREQAAEESRKAGRGIRRIARVRLAGITHVWSFPLSGNVLNKPLDSSFRWNDGGRIPAPQSLPPSPSFRRRPESRRAGRGNEGWQGLSDGAFGCRCDGEGWIPVYIGMTGWWMPAFAGMTEVVMCFSKAMSAGAGRVC